MKLIKHVEGITDRKDTVEYFKNEFLRRRAEIARKTYGKGSIEIEDIYIDEYEEQCEKAVEGDVVAQDLLSYWFKHGNPALPENIETSMKWLFLAGSNGNKHSINKLTLFFNYAYDSICYSDYYSDLMDLLDLRSDNFQIVLGEIICKFIVEEMQLDMLKLTQETPTEVKFNQLSMQRLTAHLNRALPKVDDYFRNFIAKNKK